MRHWIILFTSSTLLALVVAFGSSTAYGIGPYTVTINGYTVIDTGTGLEWQQADDGTPRTWQDSLSYCENLSLDGRDDWRLPNLREIVSIVDYSAYNPSIDAAFTIQLPKYSNYWSSTTIGMLTEPAYEGLTMIAWHVGFYNGIIGGWFKTSAHYVLCVRAGLSDSGPINTPPVAEAGLDQPVIQIGSIIQLDGTQSYDLEGDPITYLWAFISKPEGSNATFPDPTLPTPTFQADIHGDYIIELVVSDASSSSEPDTVTVSFENITPVANAGTNQTVVQGKTVCFDGSGSFDANLDPLTYFWSIISLPDGSLAFLDDPTAITPCMTTDLAGNYDVSLIVNDGFVDSEPSDPPVRVLAIAYPDATTEILQETITVTNNIDLGDFKNKNMQNSLTNKINATLELVDQGAYTEARDKLQNDILGKTDGCATLGEPDRNDWIQDCASQDQVYPLIIEAIEYLESM